MLVSDFAPKLAGLIKADRERSESNRRARYYGPTTKCLKRFANEVQKCEQHTAAVSAFLKFV